MTTSQNTEPEKTGILGWFKTSFGQIILSLLAIAGMAIYLWQGFVFLKNAEMPQLVQILVAILWGVGGIGLFYYVMNWIVEKLPSKWIRRLQPFVFVGPAIFIMAWFLAIPAIRTFVASFRNDIGTEWVGIKNYIFAFTDPRMLETFRNNLLWMILGTSMSVIFGLLIAVLADRTRFEVVYKSIIFAPMAISFVGAGVIWKFVYTYKGTGAGVQEIGLLNAIILAFGGQSQPWLNIPPWNNLFLIVIMIWLQTGYAMVILSSAIKGVPSELLEAARIDGASEIKAFFNITIPYIQGTLITVITTIVIFSLKTFDIVRVMTGGNFGTNVIANEFYLESFTYNNAGRAAAIAIILLVAVIPVIVNNLRHYNMNKRGF